MPHYLMSRAVSDIDNVFNYINTFSIWMFMKACRLYNMAKEFIQSNQVLNSLVQELTYQSQTIYSFLTLQQMEPREPIWLSTCWINRQSSDTYSENFGYFFTRTFSNDLMDYNREGFAEYAIKYLETLCKTENNSSRIDPLIVIKTMTPENMPFYIVKKATKPLTNFVYKKNLNRFISIEYHHPDMTSTIELTLGTEWFIEGNELFTPTFVLRMLKYQSQSFLYDNSYKVRIMDSECAIFELDSSCYIELTEDGYIKYNITE
jgi:hypothetical protein